jgi:hypothetical protein
MVKPHTLSRERLALAEAHQQHAAALAARAEADEAHDLATRDFYGAQATVAEIAREIRQLKETRTYGVPDLLQQVNEKLSVAYSRSDNATRAIAPFADAATAAKARLDATNSPIHSAMMRLTDAAVAVVRAEASPAAQAALAPLQEAFATIIATGPDVLALFDAQLLTSDVEREAADSAAMLRAFLSVSRVFESRYRNNPWRIAARHLQDDPTATLPAAAS